MGKGTRNNGQADESSKTEGIERRVENAKYCYDLVNSWIGNADNKVSVYCGVFTGVFGVVTFLAERTGGMIMNGCWYFVYRSFSGISLFLLALAIYSYVRAIIPNLGSSGKKDITGRAIKKYPIYFGDIAEIGDVADFKATITNASESDLIDELLTETHYNSGICIQKMQNYRRGVRLSFASVICACLSLGVKILM